MKGDVFSLGDIQSNETNLWRETSFALHLIKQAVNPILGLKKCIKNWRNIAKYLSENQRNRKRYVDNIKFLS
jgi:hypothetical protein